MERKTTDMAVPPGEPTGPEIPTQEARQGKPMGVVRVVMTIAFIGAAIGMFIAWYMIAR